MLSKTRHVQFIQLSTLILITISIYLTGVCVFPGILPGHWYVHDSSAFKLFKAFKTHSEAGAVCAANGGELVTINNENDNEFLSKVLLPKITIGTQTENVIFIYEECP